MTWYVYILKCSDDTLYTGITTELERRVAEHNDPSKKGAKYTKMRQPVSLIYSEKSENRSTASVREAEIKKMKRAEKLEMIQRFKTTLRSSEDRKRY